MVIVRSIVVPFHPMDQPIESGRVLALDYGKRRIGLAVSDELGITAQGLETLRRTTIRDDFRHLADLATRLGVVRIVVGDPIHMSGVRGEQSDNAREFAARLAGKTGLPVDFWDERLTTVEAERILKESGISRQKRGQAVDRLAAVIILQSYLEWRTTQQTDPTAEN